MPKEIPLPDWTGEPVYIIGGGPSLRTFDFQKMMGLNTIGCNHDFLLGAAICNICLFNDPDFWTECQNERKEDMLAYSGWVVGTSSGNYTPAWLHKKKRKETGLSRDPSILGINFNTGATAINLALLLGASRVYLLGIDMDTVREDGRVKAHWHTANKLKHPARYSRFQTGFDHVKADLPTVFPDRIVLNATDGSSKLRGFERVTIQAALEYGYEQSLAS